MFTNPLTIAAGLGALLALLGLGTFLFQAGCALADVNDRGYLRALPVYSATLIVSLPLAALLIWFAGRFDGNPDGFGNMRIVAAVLALLLTWLLSSVIYRLLVAGSLRKGLVIAGVELVLMALLAVLVAAVVMVVLAVVQISTRPSPRAAQAPLSLHRVQPPVSS